MTQNATVFNIYSYSNNKPQLLTMTSRSVLLDLRKHVEWKNCCLSNIGLNKSQLLTFLYRRAFC